MRAKKQKEDAKSREYFIVMNSRLEYFCGMMYGGQLVWSSDYNEAKPLDDEAKFRTLQSLVYNEELIMDYI